MYNNKIRTTYICQQSLEDKLFLQEIYVSICFLCKSGHNRSSAMMKVINNYEITLNDIIFEQGEDNFKNIIDIEDLDNSWFECSIIVFRELKARQRYLFKKGLNYVL